MGHVNNGCANVQADQYRWKDSWIHYQLLGGNPHSLRSECV